MNFFKKKNIPLFQKDNQGFTLLELVIAMTITAVIGVIIASSMSLTIRARGVINKRSQADQRARIILDRLSKEIASVYLYKYSKKIGASFTSNTPPPGTNNPKKKLLAFHGDSTVLQFVSVSQMLDPEESQGGLKEVSISSGEWSAENGQSIYIEEKRLNPLEPFKKGVTDPVEIFSDRVADLSFRYYVLNRKKDIVSSEISYSGEWKSSFGGDKLVEEINLEEVDVKKLPSFLDPILSGVEVTLSLYEAEENLPVDTEFTIEYPPLFIPINVEKTFPITADML